jgi:hypothetical protein
MNANALRQVIDSIHPAFTPSPAPRHLWVVPSDVEQPGAAPASQRSAAAVEVEQRRAAWARLLTFLAHGSSDLGGAYERTRTRLIEFFLAKGARDAEELADVTFDRLASKLTAEHLQTIAKPLGFVLRFGRFMYLESVNGQSYRRRCLQLLGNESAAEAEAEAVDSLDDGAGRLATLRRCLAELEPRERALLIAYYQHQGRDRINSRQELSRTLGLSPALLRTRMARLRADVEQRVRAQLAD